MNIEKFYDYLLVKCAFSDVTIENYQQNTNTLCLIIYESGVIYGGF